jgi:hypothetical protein
MDHQDALRRGAAEQYLLNEMPRPERDEFETHFFECQECAADLRATAAFLDGAKMELRRSRAAHPVRATHPARATRPARATANKPWFESLWRPAVAAPAFALLLLVVAYQNIVIFPRFAGASAQLKNPEILTSLSLIGGNSRGGAIPTAAIAPGQAMLLSLDIPTAERFSSYACVLIAPSGAVVWSLPVSATEAKDTVDIRVPAGVLAPGNYRLLIQGLANAGETPADLANYRFTLNGSK